ncbi:MAG: hydrogenase nickel incorporation protein HypB [Candidatus Bathyarchaeia archaeon]
MEVAALEDGGLESESIPVIAVKEDEALEIELSEDLLEENRRLAAEVRRILDKHEVFAVDVMGSIGSGKTSIIENLVQRLKNTLRVGMIAGDAASTIDARRVMKHGVPTVQVNTGRECHLDGNLVLKALDKLSLEGLDLLFIENVGNLICPADYPLGAHRRLVVISVTEGCDMVVKHPLIFREADVLAVNKMDLAHLMDVKVDKMGGEALMLNRRIKVVYTSAKTGEGINDLIDALEIPLKPREKLG